MSLLSFENPVDHLLSILEYWDVEPVEELELESEEVVLKLEPEEVVIELDFESLTPTCSALTSTCKQTLVTSKYYVNNI